MTKFNLQVSDDETDEVDVEVGDDTNAVENVKDNNIEVEDNPSVIENVNDVNGNNVETENNTNTIENGNDNDNNVGDNNIEETGGDGNEELVSIPPKKGELSRLKKSIRFCFDSRIMETIFDVQHDGLLFFD